MPTSIGVTRLASGTVTGYLVGRKADEKTTNTEYTYDDDGNVTGITETSEQPRDGDPDTFEMGGAVTFSPTVRHLTWTPEGGKPQMIHLADVACSFDAHGTLVGPDGENDVVLTATDAPGITPTGWGWKVSFTDFRDGDGALVAGADPDRDSFVISLPAGSTVDLAVAEAAAGAAANPKYVVVDATVAQAAAKSAADAKAWAEQAKSIANLTNADGSKASRVSPLASKRVLVMGDSISNDAYDNYHKWVTDLVEDGTLTSSNVTNNSYSATGFVRTYDESGKVVYGNFVDRLKAVTDTSYDIVVTFGGINDYIGAIAWDAFTAAVDSYFSDLTTRFLGARLVVLTPLRTDNVYENKAGHYQTEYSDYIKQVARSYCLPVLDLTYESGFYPFVDAFKNRWTLVPSGYTSADGVHPNLEYGKRFLAPMIRGFLEGLYASDEVELTGYYTQAEVDELVASGGVKFHWDAGERTAATVVRGQGLSVDKYYTNFNANTGGQAGAITSYAVDETSVTVNSPIYYGGVMVPFEVEPGKTYRLTCDIPLGLLSWGGLRDLGTDADGVSSGNLHGLHADAKPTWLSNNWSESGGTQSFDIKPTTPYIYIAFGNSDKKPVTWSNIKFVKRG